MGLHRSFRDSFTPVEAETRKRCFWVIRKFDIYVGAMLGLPLTLNAEDIDQDLPTEVDDDFITEVEIKPMPEGFIPITVASNANFDLAKILSKIVKSIYPTSGFQSQEQSTSRSYSVHFSTIRELENDLQKWMENLPDALKPGGARLPWQAGPIPQLLRLAFAHAQMMLYRPFLHYVSTRHSTKTVDQRSYACAAACIGVSRNIIHISKLERKLTNGRRETNLYQQLWKWYVKAILLVRTGSPCTPHSLLSCRCSISLSKMQIRPQPARSSGMLKVAKKFWPSWQSEVWQLTGVPLL